MFVRPRVWGRWRHARRSGAGVAAALLVSAALLLVGRLAPLRGGAPAADAGQTRQVTILYTGYGQGSVDPRRICT